MFRNVVYTFLNHEEHKGHENRANAEVTKNLISN